ncbi:MAG: (Fe-S)-binding protein [Bacteroidales bacterium]|nr:(Fe-S)-binding protein [Bacteroidales bacterium]
MISNFIFSLLLIAAALLFTKNIRRISQNIKMGKKIRIDDNKSQRWKNMLLVAIGQSKMTSRPISAIMHIFVYVGFIVINIEMLEILIDGIFGTHRILAFLGSIYPVLISIFEIFAVLVILACVIFLVRRNMIRLRRFWNREMTTWPRSDANIILVTEILLMSSILVMNAADGLLQARGDAYYPAMGAFLISDLMHGWFSGLSDSSLIALERAGWWFHIIGVLIFLNYIPYSKHLHVFLSFPNVYFGKLGPLGKMDNMPGITNEIKMMLNPEMATAASEAPPADDIGQFGAKDATDLNWKQLMDAYTCTECGRCTSSCPANITGKKLSPRKIVMDVRDRIEEIGKNVKKNGKGADDGQSLFDRISDEELWACTTCNACVQECPVNIDPLAVILELRRYLVMEKAAAPGELNAAFSNIENNGAPWQFSNEDRMQWAG